MRAPFLDTTPILNELVHAKLYTQPTVAHRWIEILKKMIYFKGLNLKVMDQALG